MPALLLFAVSACGTTPIDYYWAPYPIAEKRVTTTSALARGGSVSIINAQTKSDPRMVAAVGRYRYHSSLAQFGNAIVTQLTDELKKRNITVTDNAEKSLRINVTSASAEQGAWTIRAYLGYEITAGNGYRITQPIRHGSPTTAPRALNGAVALAVIAILNDPKIVEYLTASP